MSNLGWTERITEFLVAYGWVSGRIFNASLPCVRLREQGFIFTRLDGSLNQKKRESAIQAFQDPAPGSPTIMLLSLKAGGVGLNLTAASRVFLMDPVSGQALAMSYSRTSKASA